jgi:hypothetical protein
VEEEVQSFNQSETGIAFGVFKLSFQKKLSKDETFTHRQTGRR